MNETASALHAALAERFGEAVEVPDGLRGIPELLRIATHATHRDWAATPVEPALVRLVAACALCAPSKSHLQQADIVQVRDPALRAGVESLVPSMPWIRKAPVLLVFCGNGRRFRRIFQRRAMPFVNEHLDGFFNPVVDASLVMMNAIRAAAAVGLVCCPISVLRDQAPRLAAILALPDHVVPIAGLCLGFPVAARSITPRLPLAATLHTDRFDDADADRHIDEFDRRYIEARERHLPRTPQQPASWSDERTRQYASPQRADWGRFVRSRGFDLS
jgi:nitroreductase